MSTSITKLSSVSTETFAIPYSSDQNMGDAEAYLHTGPQNSEMFKMLFDHLVPIYSIGEGKSKVIKQLLVDMPSCP